jgi:sterol desaturase/sphingolipid hydroxylase (fatty acid hydroxylase superfamily)
MPALSHHFPWSTLILTGVYVVGAVVFHMLEGLRPIYPALRRGPGRRSYLADFTAAVVDGPVLSAASKLGACYVILLAPQYYGLLDRWPWLVQFAVFFVFNDFMRYWLHRWYHVYPILWRLHRVHHSAIEMDAMSNFRAHALEAVIKYGVVIFPFHVFGMDPWVLIIYSSIDILKGYWHHANLRTGIGRLNYWFNSPEQHWWHHSAEPGGKFVNFGSALSIWDRMFGTFYWERGKWPESVGVYNMERFPDDYLGQFASAVYDDAAAERRFHAPCVSQVAPPLTDTGSDEESQFTRAAT